MKAPPLRYLYIAPFSRYDYFNVVLIRFINTYKGLTMNKVFGTVLLSSMIILSGCKWFGCNCHDKNCGCHHSEKQVTPEKNVNVVEDVTTQESYDKALKGSKPVIAKFSAPWCGACQTMTPIFKTIAQKLNDKYTFIEVNVDQVQDPANELGIRGIPTFVFFKDGKEVNEDNRVVGATSQETLESAIKKAFGE
jgi:thioredoxin